MAICKCKMCGGDLQITELDKVVECEYCGTTQTVPSADNEKKMAMFNRANKLRLNNEFDKAAGIYESITADFPEEAEAYWGIILCKYGIEYVDDPASGKKIPTCHRSSFDSLLEDDVFEQACENADAIARRIYRDEAKKIEEIRKGIIEVSSKEEPYDIFICYKETDEAGGRTLDSAIAQDVYTALTEKGYRVFFSRISLEDKLGVEYEPYIFAALNSAKIMLAFGTDFDYFNAVWVKNEWSRFLQLIANGEKKYLIPCYKDIDAYDMPKEFAKLQSQDMGKVGAIQDLLRGIEKILPKNAKSVPIQQVAPANSTDVLTAGLLKRAFMLLEEGEWKKADDLCEQVLNINPECAEGYLGKLMAELKVSSKENLKDCKEPFDDRNSYQKVIIFANEKLKTEIQDCSMLITFNIAKNKMHSAKTDVDFYEAADLFAKIKYYENSEELHKKCIENADICYKEVIYSSAKSKMYGENIADYEAAIEKFNVIADWKDSAEMIGVCNNKIKDINAAAEKEKAEVEAIHTKVQNINSTINTKEKQLADLKNKLSTLGIFAGKEKKVINAEIEKITIELNKEIEDRNALLLKLSVSQQVLYNQDTVFFGNYHGLIEWLILKRENNKILVISKYALDRQPYNNICMGVTWESCSLRKWLNGTFLNNAFSAEEQGSIQSTTVSAGKNPKYRTNPSNATTDKVFLLSITEAEKYFSSDEYRKCIPTEYAIAEGAWTSGISTKGGKPTCCWWLRAPGYIQKCAAGVNMRGSVHYSGFDVDTVQTCVRPAMWISLE